MSSMSGAKLRLFWRFLQNFILGSASIHHLFIIYSSSIHHPSILYPPYPHRFTIPPFLL
ncbi:MAG: hypothetical protein M1282_04985 [Chloroflexi bacterium]|nr:hypothetical protein [Chloroflexota bacterium]